MVKELISPDQLELNSEFDPNWVLHTFKHVPHLSYAWRITITAPNLISEYRVHTSQPNALQVLIKAVYKLVDGLKLEIPSSNTLLSDGLRLKVFFRI